MLIHIDHFIQGKVLGFQARMTTLYEDVPMVSSSFQGGWRLLRSRHLLRMAERDAVIDFGRYMGLFSCLSCFSRSAHLIPNTFSVVIRWLRTTISVCELLHVVCCRNWITSWCRRLTRTMGSCFHSMTRTPTWFICAARSVITSRHCVSLYLCVCACFGVSLSLSFMVLCYCVAITEVIISILTTSFIPLCDGLASVCWISLNLCWISLN